MNFNRLIIISILFIAGGALAFSFLHHPVAGITMYSEGRSKHIPATTAEYRQVRALMENLFEGATSASLEGVDSRLISEMQSTGTSVELIYDRPVKLQPPAWTHSDYYADRILVRLKGTHEGWVFYGNGHYESGPFYSDDPQVFRQIEGLIAAQF